MYLFYLIIHGRGRTTLQLHRPQQQLEVALIFLFCFFFFTQNVFRGELKKKLHG